MTDLVMDLNGCARCGGGSEGGHKGLVFQEFDEPVEIEHTTLTHWAMCPTLNEPILLTIIPNGRTPDE